MKKIDRFYADFKIFMVISLASGSLIILFSLLGHFIRRGDLIPFVMTGGSIGILAGILFLYRKRLIKKVDIMAVAVCSLISFGLISLIAIFNFDKPFLILFSFLLIGFTAVISNRYFRKHTNISNSLRYGLFGIVLILPSFYFIFSNILKFRFGINGPYNFIEYLLQNKYGQANFNAISPFIFGGGLALAFFINLFEQIQFIKSNTSITWFRLIRTNLHILNLAIVLMSCCLSSVILTYLILEN
jgi:hypothetical protein